MSLLPSKMSRNALERVLDDLNAKCAEVSASIEAIRTEMQERLAGPLKTLAALQVDQSACRAELEARERRDAVVPTVSDHALLRYIERVHDIDMDQLRQHILSPAVVQAMKLGAGAIKTDECTFVLKDMTVVTVKSADMIKSPKKNRPPRWHENDDESEAA